MQSRSGVEVCEVVRLELASNVCELHVHATGNTSGIMVLRCYGIMVHTGMCKEDRVMSILTVIHSKYGNVCISRHSTVPTSAFRVKC